MAVAVYVGVSDALMTRTTNGEAPEGGSGLGLTATTVAIAAAATNGSRVGRRPVWGN